MVHKIDTPNATPGGEFQEKNHATGAAGTTLSADYMNETVQESIIDVVEAAGLTPTKGTPGQFLQALNLLYGSGALQGFSNKLINGGFRIWQRASEFLAISAGNSQYTADRWLAYAGDGGGAALDVRRRNFTPGQTAVPGEPEHYLEFDQTTAASTDAPTLSQRIEDVRTFAGGKMSFSTYLRCDSGTQDVVVHALQNFGTSGSTKVDTVGPTLNVGTSWARFTGTITVPSISGKTLGGGAEPDHFLALVFEMPQGVTFTMDVADVSAQPGSLANTFAFRPFGIDLAMALRYYRKTYPFDTTVPTAGKDGHLNRWAGSAGGLDSLNGNRVLDVQFSPEMRAAPAVTYYAPQSTVANRVSWGSGTPDTGGPQMNGTRHNTGYPDDLTGDSSPANELVQFHYEADAEL